MPPPMGTARGGQGAVAGRRSVNGPTRCGPTRRGDMFPAADVGPTAWTPEADRQL